MNYLRSVLMSLAVLLAGSVSAQDLASLNGTPYNEAGGNSIYLLSKWYPGSIRTTTDQFYDGVQLRYDLKNDQIEYRKDSATFRVAEGVKEFTIPSGTDLYIFRSGFPSGKGLSEKSFYRVMYDGNTKLLKRYQSEITTEKASATRTMEPDALLYIEKNNKLTPVNLKNKSSFLKLLSDEKNKMNYVIKEENLEFDGDDDLVKLLEEYDSYKAGRGGDN
ncbi:MAG TPA: hypothetical protein VGN64_07435 [Dyadobacter sp.]|nr:hypothetical protein [Dyadobacter sp.]